MILEADQLGCAPLAHDAASPAVLAIAKLADALSGNCVSAPGTLQPGLTTVSGVPEHRHRPPMVRFATASAVSPSTKA
jgi:hypothetical protein